jgi:3-dehydroquinate synthase
VSATFDISSRTGSYGVRIGSDILAETVRTYPEALFIVDDKLLDRLPEGTSRVLAVEASETTKTLEIMPDYIGRMRELGANRDTHLVVIGGGTIQDTATFLASIYMRGLSWIYMPSTVLAMADSCIGGKSSINVLGYKNLVGNFHPPREIVIDLDLVTTLDREMVVGGLFEAGKICFAHGPDRFREYLRLAPEAAMSPAALLPIVDLSLRTKKWFIEIDEFDKRERLLLNFGHTFGHAIEGATEYEVSHGIAVGVGMLAACIFAERQEIITSEGRENVMALRQHILTMLEIGTDPVIARPPRIGIDVVLQKFEYDKKHRTAAYSLVLPENDGRLALRTIPRDAETRKAIRAAYEEALEGIGWSGNGLHG